MYTNIDIRVGSKATAEVQWLIIQWLLNHQFEKVQINTYDGIGVDVTLADNSIEETTVKEIAESLEAWGRCLYIGKEGIKTHKLEVNIDIDYHGIEKAWSYLRIPYYYDDGTAYCIEEGGLIIEEGDF